MKKQRHRSARPKRARNFSKGRRKRQALTFELLETRRLLAADLASVISYDGALDVLDDDSVSFIVDNDHDLAISVGDYFVGVLRIGSTTKVGVLDPTDQLVSIYSLEVESSIGAFGGDPTVTVGFGGIDPALGTGWSIDELLGVPVGTYGSNATNAFLSDSGNPTDITDLTFSAAMVELTGPGSDYVLDAVLGLGNADDYFEIQSYRDRNDSGEIDYSELPRESPAGSFVGSETGGLSFLYHNLGPGIGFDNVASTHSDGSTITLHDVGVSGALYGPRSDTPTGYQITDTTQFVFNPVDDIVDTAALGDFVFEDTNANGIQDVGEPGIDGVTVNLMDSGMNVIDTMVTAGGGAYAFTDLIPDDYFVQFITPGGYIQTAQDVPNDGSNQDGNTDSDAGALGKTELITLSSGETDNTIDAGYYQLAALGDFVFEDTNANGLQDVGEPGIDGVTVNLMDSGMNVIDTMVTAGGGAYAFTDLIPDDYFVQFITPGGYIQTEQDVPNDGSNQDGNTDSDAGALGKTELITLSSGETDNTIDAGYNQLAALGDFVFEDTNANGIQDVGEPGIDGVTVNLMDSGMNVIDTMVTAGGGSYAFTDLIPDDYFVQFITPGGYIQTAQDVPNDGSNQDGNTDSDAGALGKTELITLSSGETDNTIDAGYYQLAALGDFVFEDTNANGIQDVGEPGIDGVTVNLMDSGMNVIDSMVTAGGGAYAFTDLVPDDYFVQFITPGGYIQTAQDVPNDGSNQDGNTDSDAGALGKTELITLSSGETDNTIDAGYYQLAALGDFVFEDTNANGLQDVGEPGIDGVTVNLMDSDMNVIDSMVTAGGGAYAFTDLIPDDYFVQFITPGGYIQTEQDVPNDGSNQDGNTDSDAGALGKTELITLSSGETDNTIDAGYYQLAALGDFVWYDTNGDGIQQAGEQGVEDVTVTLTGTDGQGNAVFDTMTTAADGSYLFDNLVPGDYKVTFSDLPAGFVFTVQDQGADDELDSDADPNTGMAIVTTLVSGESDLSWDAGIVQPAIAIIKKVLDPETGLFTDDVVTFQAGSLVTFGYFVTNSSHVSLSNVVVVDDNATPGDPSDDVDSDPGSGLPTDIIFIGGDSAPANGLLDPGETWMYEFTRTADFIAGGGGPFGGVSEMNRYLLIGTTSNEIAKGVNVQNGDLGADIVVLSTEINDNVDFDLDDLFLNNAGGVWVDVDNTYNTGSDYLPGAAQVGEGVSWTGDVALTSPDGKFDMSNVELYGQVGVVADSNSPVSSVSNSEYFSNGLGDGFDTTGDGLNLPPNGVTSNADAQMAALRAELDAFEFFVTNLLPEATLSPGSGLPTSDGIEDVDVFELNVDQYDTNGDGIAVIDILVDGGDSDFKITNSNWIIESENGTFAIFRILGDSNLVLNQSTIVMGDGIFGNGGQDGVGPGVAVTDLGAIFIKAAEFKNAQGQFNDGEALDSGDTVFSFNDTVLNGVGFYDLIAFNDSNNDPFFDNGTTELKINNGQGCAQFISPKINFNNVRFERCMIPEGGDEEQTNTADATGMAFGVIVSDSDTQTIIVSSTDPGNNAPVAEDDGYTVEQDSTLYQNGVLDNDSDPDGDSLTSTVVDDPLNGTLDLNADGTFTYTPFAGYSGTDSFTYLASDGVATSNTATVTIEVTSSEPPEKRFYVVDTSSDTAFVYSPDGSSVTDFGLDGDNSTSRGAAANVAGDLLWVIDRDKSVYKYNGEGELQSKWTGGGLYRPEGIATDEVHIWIVDRMYDRVFFYENAATATTNQSPTSNFSLASNNESPRGITTDGIHLWVVNDGKNVDRVFKYTVSGTYVGSWTIDSANSKPRGITIDPSNVDHLWTVDARTDQVFMYESSVDRTSGSQSAGSTFDLLPGNGSPQGIADPPIDVPTQDDAKTIGSLSIPFFDTSPIGRDTLGSLSVRHFDWLASNRPMTGKHSYWNGIDDENAEFALAGTDAISGSLMEDPGGSEADVFEIVAETEDSLRTKVEDFGNELLKMIPAEAALAKAFSSN